MNSNSAETALLLQAILQRQSEINSAWQEVIKWSRQVAILEVHGCHLDPDGSLAQMNDRDASELVEQYLRSVRAAAKRALLIEGLPMEQQR